MRFFFGLIAMMSVAIAGSPSIAAKKQKAPPTPPVTARLAPPPMTDKENLLYLDLSTGGRVVIWLRPDVAPKMVERVKTLTRQHFYDGLKFHRVIDGFMAQGGDPQGTGQGGSPLPDLKAEFNDMPHVRGVVSMARAESNDSANSQFYIMLMPTLRLDNRYTAFGRVVSGMQFVDAIEKGEPPVNPSRIVRAWIQADGENAPLRPLPAAAAPAPAATPVPEPAPTPTPQPTPNN
jgi:cyclophilin family peptidyl-prolyl cis-trans isomerase